MAKEFPLSLFLDGSTTNDKSKSKTSLKLPYYSP